MFNPYGDSNEAFILLMGQYQAQQQQQQTGCKCCGYWPCVYAPPPQIHPDGQGCISVDPEQQPQQPTLALITLLGGNGGAFGGFEAWDATRNPAPPTVDPSAQFYGPVSVAFESAAQGGDYTAALVGGVIDRAAEQEAPTWPPSSGWWSHIPGEF